MAGGKEGSDTLGKGRRELGAPLLVASTLLGALMLFFCARALLSPEAYEGMFGVGVAEGGAYWFHYAQGARDGVLGLAVLAFAWLGRRGALAVFLPLLAVQPLGDAAIVLAAGGGPGSAAPHLAGALYVLALAVFVWRRPSRGAAGPAAGAAVAR